RSRSREANDIFRLVSEFENEKYPAPLIFMDCGKLDSFLNVNREFSHKLAECGISHSYREFAGGHDWVYWNRRLRNILRVANEVLR
ncbi:MAG: alpha/beta hydrolase-fold protein, partial [Candidatus Binatia bacterium]